jgi:hypothetical protein
MKPTWNPVRLTCDHDSINLHESLGAEPFRCVYLYNVRSRGSRCMTLLHWNPSTVSVTCEAQASAEAWATKESYWESAPYFRAHKTPQMRRRALPSVKAGEHLPSIWASGDETQGDFWRRFCGKNASRRGNSLLHTRIIQRSRTRGLNGNLLVFSYEGIGVQHIRKQNKFITHRVYSRWRSWLRHCATSREVAGSIPDGVTGIFHWHNPFGRTMALGFTQPLTEMSTRNVSWR